MKKGYLLSLVLVAFLIRVWHSGEFFFWNVDEEMVSLTIKRIVVDHIPQLIGFPVPGGIYLGPLFYYLFSPFYLLSFMDPQGLAFFSAVITSLTVYFVFLTGRYIFKNAGIGLIAATLYGFSYLTYVYAHVFTGLTFVPLLALATYYLIAKIAENANQKYVYALGIILIISTQNEATSLSLPLLALLSWLILKLKVRMKTFLILSAGFIFSLAPLLVFNLRHNNYLINSIANFLTLPSKHTGSLSGFEIFYNVVMILPTTMARFLFVNGPRNIADQILPCADLLADRQATLIYPLIVISTFALFYFIFKTLKAKELGSKIILTHLALIFGGIALFNLFLRGYFFEWMLVIFFPGIAFIFAYFLNHLTKYGLWGRSLMVASILIFILINVKSVLETNADFGLKNKRAAVSYALEKVNGRPFELDSIGSCYAQGYIYLFWQSGQLPIKSYADDMFSSTLKLNPQSIKPQVKVVIVNPSRQESEQFQTKYKSYLKSSKTSARFGKIRVLIIG